MKISPSEFYNFISSIGIDFFTGVPDSLLKEFCLCIDDVAPSNSHIITANEGNAIALAIGYNNVFRAKTKDEIKNSITELLNCIGPDLLGIKIKPGSRVDLGRPTNSPIENKILFSKFIQ